MDFHIREAAAEDAEQVVAAHEASWDATLAELAGRTLAELAPFDARLQSFRSGIAAGGPDARIWVAEADGEIVGLAVARRIDATMVELKDLYVAPRAWGTGVARALMDEALASLGDFDVANLWVVEANARARRFYEREGWRPDGATRATPFGAGELRYARP